MAQRAPLPYRAPQPRVISPSVVLLKSRTQSDSSLLRGSRGGCRRAPQNLPQREPSGCRRFRRGAQIPAPCARRAHPCSRRAHPCSRRTYPCSRRKKSRAQNEHGTFGKNSYYARSFAPSFSSSLSTFATARSHSSTVRVRSGARRVME